MVAGLVTAAAKGGEAEKHGRNAWAFGCREKLGGAHNKLNL